MSYADKIQALLRWCQQQTDGYANVRVRNFTSSFKDGLAFCAILHRYRPDLVNFHSLQPADWLENNRLAFETAETLGIPALLDAEDMEVPEKLSIITYVTYYNLNLQGRRKASRSGSCITSSTRKATNRSSSDSADQEVTGSDTAKSTYRGNSRSYNASKNEAGSIPFINPWQFSRRSPQRPAAVCAQCGDPVFFLERHIEAGKLYHRQCHLEDRRQSLHRA
uniref:Calponin-homology (CH) domain-containing protein n=1 Tax=Macrostomum lignano TaxID=282301 RepID=A0A1I8J919_9PLAT